MEQTNKSQPSKSQSTGPAPVATTEEISVFDLFKIGIGPSSSHTMGPWKAATAFLKEIDHRAVLQKVTHLTVQLYGSLAKTGHGHATPMGVCLGLMGEAPAEIAPHRISQKMAALAETQTIKLLGKKTIPFSHKKHLQFHYQTTLPRHPNALRFQVDLQGGGALTQVYYSTGGGFIEKEPLLTAAGKPLSASGVSSASKASAPPSSRFPYPINRAAQLLHHCETTGKKIHELVWENELSHRRATEVTDYLNAVKQAMVEAIFRGCHQAGLLPGGLKVKRRAAELSKNLLNRAGLAAAKEPPRFADWLALIKQTPTDFKTVTSWVTCFALAVNEENAANGRVVTAPTNGAAGVIPAVLLYYLTFEKKPLPEAVATKRFLLVASEIGSLFKKGASISAAAGGCQAEIGVSSAMAAAGLTSLYNDSPQKILMAAEIAMEHHLGLTCDPIKGLVQIPCIERNSMGAIKAITASQLALSSDPKRAVVSLDEVIATMWETAKDMHHKYKETSEGGLAVNVSVGYSEC